MKQYPIHIRKIKTQFKAFFYRYNTKHPGFSKIHSHIRLFFYLCVVVVFQCNSQASVNTHYFFFFYTITKIIKYADEVFICCNIVRQLVMHSDS